MKEAWAKPSERAIQKKRAGHRPALRVFSWRYGLRAHLAHELGRQVGLQAFDAAFVAVAAVLDAAERRLGEREAEMVDRDHAAVKLVGDRRGRLGRFRERVGGK